MMAVATEPEVKRTRTRGKRLRKAGDFSNPTKDRTRESYRANSPEAKVRQLSALRGVRDFEAELAACNVIEFAEEWLGVSFEERPAQRVALKVIYGLPLETEEELALYALMTGGLKVQHGLDQEAVEALLSLGARSGKSLLTAICALYESTARAHIWRQYLRPNEVGYAVITATRQKQAEAVIQANCAQLLSGSERARKLIDGEPYRAELRLRTGMRIISLPCSSRAGRGLPIFFLAHDEQAHYFHEGPKADSEIYNALSPRLSQFPGAKTVIPSTPAAKQGMFWEWFNEGFEVPGRVTFQAETLVMNPLVDRDFLARQKRRDPDNYAREYGAQFAEKLSAFFPQDKLDLCFTLAGNQAPRRGNLYYLGIDQSGLAGRDRFALSIAHQEPDGEIIVDVVDSWDSDDDSVLVHVQSYARQYGVHRATIDRYGAGWVRSAIEKLGLEVDVRERLPVVYMNVKTLMIAEQLRLPDSVGLRKGFLNTTAYYGRNNALSIAHERTALGHADEADAVATAVFAATTLEQPEERLVIERFDAIARFGGTIRDLRGAIR